jgi:Asp-tRNA(Asn)/Glu-tRNA(Gln) amidotransferase A subunit family amidase
VLADLFGGRPQHGCVNAIVREAVADIARLGATVIHLPLQPALIAALDESAVLDDEFVRDLNEFLHQVPYRDAPELHALAARTEPRDRVTLDDIMATGEVVPSVQRLLVMRSELARRPDFEQGYQHHLAQRRETQRLLDELMTDYELDALVFPCQQVPAAVIGTHQDGYYPSGLSSNTGWPALTVPAGRTADALPVGIEFLARPYQEALLLGLGYAYVQATRHRVPPRHS